MEKPRILVLGADGLVGSRFLQISKNRDYMHFPNRLEVDIANISSVHNLFRTYDFRAVINFAAFTDVNAAESQRGNQNDLCYQVNALGVTNLLEAIEPLTHKTHFIQISTDFVFPGNSEMKGPYEEVETPNLPPEKLTWYGYTKAVAEKRIMEMLPERASILRIICPVRANYDVKSDFLRKPLKMFDEGKLYPIFNDQTVSIAFIDEVVKALDIIIQKQAYGIYHASSNDTGTPYEIISYLIEKARGVKGAVKPASLDEYLKNTGSPSIRYHKYGGLSVRRTQANLGIRFSTWKGIVDKLVEQGITP